MQKRYVSVMILCFIFGGYFLFSSFYQARAFSLGTGSGVFPEPPNLPNGFNESRLNRVARQNPLTAAIPLQIGGGIVLIIAGMSIWYLTNEKELKIVKDYVTNSLLLPEEKTVLKELKKQGGQLTQKKLAMETRLTKVKVHRVLNRLEEKRLIKRHPYGSTRMVVLEDK